MRVRRVVPAFVVIVGLLVALAPAAQARTTRQRVIGRVNEIRQQHGLRRLECTRSVNAIAQDHSRRMAATRRMYHTPGLFSKITGVTRARTWGENVGYAPHAWRVVRMWMRSPSHRQNILTGRFRKCGVGAVKSGGTYWLTLIFYG